MCVLCVAFVESVDAISIRPLFGPRAGGTRVTITGHFVKMTNISAVYFGDNEGYLDTNRLSCQLFS